MVATDDLDTDGISIAADKLTGTIVAASDSTVPATLAHPAVPADPGHRVDGVRPTVVGAASNEEGTKVIVTFSEPLGSVSSRRSDFVLLDHTTHPSRQFPTRWWARRSN